MKLLIATGLYAPEIGGPATHTAVLEKLLPEEGVGVFVVPYSLARAYPKWLAHLIYFFLLVREGRGAEVVYALDPVSVGFPAYWASKVLRARFIVRIAGDRAWEAWQSRTQLEKITESLDTFSQHNSICHYGVQVWVLKRIQAFVAKRAELVVPSVYLSNIVFRWGVPREHISVVHNGLNGIPTIGDRRIIRKLLNFDGIMMTSAGRLVPWKGFRLLIELMPELLKRYPQLKLFIIGDGPDMNILENRARELSVDRSVSFAGALPSEVLLSYIQASDIFVLNTGYEGFSHQLLEVMGQGVPVVTTSVGGNPELIIHKKNGLLVGYNNKKQLLRAIVEVLEKPALRKKLIKNALEIVKGYTHEKMVDDLLLVLRKEM